MAGRLHWTEKLSAFLACSGYACSVNAAGLEQQVAIVRSAIAIISLLALAFWIIRRSPHKVLWLTAFIIAALTAYLLQSYLDVTMAYGLPHAAINLFLLCFFGRTLQRGAEPLITRLARQVHGSLKPEIEAYTRNVTIAWCIFFTCQIGASVLLFNFAPLIVWSLFISVFQLPIVMLMFTAEWGYRVRRYTDHPRVSVLQAIRAFEKDFSESKR